MDLMGKSKAPPAPDYTSAANATAAGNLDAARAAASANRVNQYTPYGSLVYSQNGDNPDSWSSQINLSDTGRQLLDASNRSQIGQSQLLDTATSRLANTIGQPFDTKGGMDGWDKASQLIMQRTNPALDQQQSALDTRLANQGVTPGSEQWKIAQTQFGNQRNDANVQAQLAGLQAQGQFYQQANTDRNQPLNELNALRTGAQVSNPTFGSSPQQQTTTGADLLGAQTSQYQAAIGQNNANNALAASQVNGVLNLGGSIAGLFSDRRLKSDIVRIGMLKGHNLYSYTKFGRREIGVMAQEVMATNPGAVSLHDSGFYMVNYGAL